MTVWYVCSKEDLKLVVMTKPGCNSLFFNLEVSGGLECFNLFRKMLERCVYLQGTGAAMAVLLLLSANISTLVLKVNCSKYRELWNVLICYFLSQCLLFLNFLTGDIQEMEFFKMLSNCLCGQSATWFTV